MGQKIPRNTVGFKKSDIKDLGCGSCVGGIMFVFMGMDGEDHVFTNKAISENNAYNTPAFCRCDAGSMKLKEWTEMTQHKEISLLKKRERAIALMEKSNIGRRFKERTLDSFKTTSPKTKALKKLAEDYVKEWPNNRAVGRGLFLCGNVGVGKTHIAAGITQRLIYDHGVQSLFLPVPDLLQRVRGSISTDGGVNDLLKLYSNVELLVLDDIGTERVTEWVAEFLYLLINARYEAMLPTLYTSNMTPNEIISKMALSNLSLTGERIVDRILEMSLVVNIGIKDSHRGKIE